LGSAPSDTRREKPTAISSAIRWWRSSSDPMGSGRRGIALGFCLAVSIDPGRKRVVARYLAGPTRGCQTGSCLGGGDPADGLGQPRGSGRRPSTSCGCGAARGRSPRRRRRHRDGGAGLVGGGSGPGGGEDQEAGVGSSQPGGVERDLDRLGGGWPTLSSFHLASASQNEDQDGFDQAGGAVWAAADLAEDAPALQLGVRPLARAALAGVCGVDLALVAR
jgi:hypothetical protein